MPLERDAPGLGTLPKAGYACTLRATPTTLALRTQTEPRRTLPAGRNLQSRAAQIPPHLPLWAKMRRAALFPIGPALGLPPSPSRSASRRAAVPRRDGPARRQKNNWLVRAGGREKITKRRDANNSPEHSRALAQMGSASCGALWAAARARARALASPDRAKDRSAHMPRSGHGAPVRVDNRAEAARTCHYMGPRRRPSAQARVH